MRNYDNGGDHEKGEPERASEGNITFVAIPAFVAFGVFVYYVLSLK